MATLFLLLFVHLQRGYPGGVGQLLLLEGGSGETGDKGGPNQSLEVVVGYKFFVKNTSSLLKQLNTIIFTVSICSPVFELTSM